MPLDGSADPRPLVSTPAYEGGGQFSPDGRWVIFASGESGRMEVYVRPFLGSDRKWLVSTDGGTHPMWSKKGDELFYRAGNRMMGVTVASDRDGLSFSPPRPSI